LPVHEKRIVVECLICGYTKIAFCSRTWHKSLIPYQQLLDGVISKKACPVCGHKSLFIKLADYDDVLYKDRDLRRIPP